MGLKRLSKNESKYRYKFIYENHLSKNEQKRLDFDVANRNDIKTPYKTMYQQYRKGDVTLFLEIVKMSKLGDVVNKLGISINEFGELCAARGVGQSGKQLEEYLKLLNFEVSNNENN